MNQIVYAVHLRSDNQYGNVHVACGTGNTKLVPRAATPVLRLKLCAALEAATAINSGGK